MNRTLPLALCITSNSEPHASVYLRCYGIIKVRPMWTIWAWVCPHEIDQGLSACKILDAIVTKSRPSLLRETILNSYSRPPLSYLL